MIGRAFCSVAYVCARDCELQQKDERESDAVETVLMIYNTPNHFVSAPLPYGPPGANLIT